MTERDKWRRVQSIGDDLERIAGVRAKTVTRFEVRFMSPLSDTPPPWATEAGDWKVTEGESPSVEHRRKLFTLLLGWLDEHEALLRDELRGLIG